MASNAVTMNRAWVKHHGAGCPLPKGTLIDVRHFNGEVTEGVRVGAFTVNDDGSLRSAPGAFSGWNYSEGGPMPPKFRSYRLRVTPEQRNAEIFRTWLDIRESVDA